MSVTHKQIQNYLRAADIWLQNNPEKTKFREAVVKVGLRCTKLMEEYKEQFEDIQIDCCETDPKTKVILRDEHGAMQFTKEGERKRNQMKTELLNAAVELTPRYVDEIPETLSELEADIFTGFVIRPDPTQAEEFDPVQAEPLGLD